VWCFFSSLKLSQVFYFTFFCGQIPEPDETYAVELGPPTGGAVQGIPIVATVTIMENDDPIVFAGHSGLFLLFSAHKYS
jgi:hypothetical protein